jgi:hypothetical protein
MAAAPSAPEALAAVSPPQAAGKDKARKSSSSCCLFNIPRTAIEDASGPAVIVGLLTAIVVFFFSSHASQRPKDGIDRLRTDPASLFKNAWTWSATTAAVSSAPLVGRTVE